jgi:hypothetical protein
MDIAAWPCGLSLLGGFRTPASHSASSFAAGVRNPSPKAGTGQRQAWRTGRVTLGHQNEPMTTVMSPC